MKSSSTASSERGGRAHPERGGRAYLGILLAGTLVALGAAEVMLRVWVVPIDSGRANRVHRVYTDERVDSVLGDSHLYRAFINSQTFANLARAGSSPHALEIVAREYYRHREPGRVILEASPQLFNALMQSRRAQRHDEYFGQNLGLPFQLYVLEPGISRELAAFASPSQLARTTSSSRGRQKPGGPVVRKEAARRRAMTDAEHHKTTQGRITSNRPVPAMTESDGFAAYRRTIDHLLAGGARLCLARTPVTRLYLELSGEEPRHLETERVFTELAREYDIPYVDFIDLDLQLDDIESFTNPDHLTTAAGERYAARLERACFKDQGAGSGS
jgi:hypothetical protein